MAATLADDIFDCIILNENDTILIQISLKYVPRSPIDNKRISKLKISHMYNISWEG